MKKPEKKSKILTGAAACANGRHHWIIMAGKKKGSVVTGCSRCPAVKP